MSSSSVWELVSTSYWRLPADWRMSGERVWPSPFQEVVVGEEVRLLGVEGVVEGVDLLLQEGAGVEEE